MLRMDEMANAPQSGGQDDRAAGAGSAAPSSLGKQLRGDLPCFACRYNLKGVSIRGVCPECGTAVRATILAMVDPLAKELRPIRRPRLVAMALCGWGLFSFIAALVTWLPYVPGLGEIDWRAVLLIAGVLSGVGAMSFVRPHDRILRGHSILAALGVMMYVPMLYFAAELAGPRWVFAGLRYPPAGHEPVTNRLYLRLLFGASLIGALLMLRPNARLLVARSLALRTGRVDRQTIMAMAVAVGAAALGDLLMLLSTRFLGVTHDTIHMAGVVLVVAGSVLLTIGTIGLMIDSFRIARSIALPTPSLAAIIHGPPGDRATPPPATDTGAPAR